jgi:putative heme-binding domain-containing protein
MESDRGERPLLGSGYFVRNPKYGAAVRDMLEAAPRLESMHHASMLLWLQDDWTGAQRKRYFTAIADAVTRSKGGHQYREVWNRIRERALEQIPAAAREEYEKLQGTPGPVTSGLPVARGPGQEWTMDQVLKIAETGLAGRDLAQGREMYAAAACILCHLFRGEGGAIGPDLTTVGQRFTLRDIVDAILHPSKAISDQYQLMTLELNDGSALSGRIVSRDERVTRLATELLRPTESRSIPNDAIRRVRPEPVSTMPSGLLNALNEDEVKDLIAYLLAPAR